MLLVQTTTDQGGGFCSVSSKRDSFRAHVRSDSKIIVNPGLFVLTLHVAKYLWNSTSSDSMASSCSAAPKISYAISCCHVKGGMSITYLFCTRDFSNNACTICPCCQTSVSNLPRQFVQHRHQQNASSVNTVNANMLYPTDCS